MNVCSKIGNRCRPALLLVLAWMALASGSVEAQTNRPTVAATLEPSIIDVGESTQYQISVVNGQADEPPPPPMVAGLTFQYVGEESNHTYNMDSLTSMRTTSSLVYTYTVRAMRAGRYVIPGQEVTVGGVALRTLPIVLTAQDNGASGATPPSRTVATELIVPKKSAYVGESIPVEVRSTFGAEVHLRPDAEVLLEGDGVSVQKFTAPKIQEQVIDGSRYNIIFYKSAITGLKTGDLTIGPAETNPILQLPATTPRQRQPNGYDPFAGFFGRSLMQPAARVKMRTEPLKLEVRPLPAGKPADFSGGIGQFKLDVEAEPRHAQTGDPVTVRLILSGQGNFDRINAPMLADERGLRVYPPNAKFKADDEVGLSGVKTFEQVIIADATRTSLPPYRFNYLDPATGKYMSLDTPPVAVRIEGANVATAPSPAAGQTAIPAAVAPTPTSARAAEDILYIRPDAGVRHDRDGFLPVYERRNFWVVQALVLLTLLAATAAVGVRARLQNAVARENAQRQREQAHLQDTLRQETTGRRDFYLAATRLAQLRARRLGSGPALTAAEISQQLDPPVARSVQDIFRHCDELAYSGGQVALEPVTVEERRGVLAALDVLAKNGK